MLKYVLLLVLSWAMLRFINRAYMQVQNILANFLSPQPGSSESTTADRDAEIDIEDADYEILPEDPENPTD